MYAVVEFITVEFNPVEVVPLTWLSENQSFLKWPVFKTQGQYRQLLSSQALPEADWKGINVKVLYLTGNLKKAEKYCKQHTVNSDVNITEIENELPAKRKKIRPWQLANSSSDDDSQTCTSTNASSSLQHFTVIHPTTSTALCSTPSTNMIETTFQKKVLTYLETILLEHRKLRRKVDQIESTLQQFPSVSSEHSNVVVSLDEQLKFPISSLAEIKAMNDNLGDTALFENAVENLSLVGGKTMSDCVTRLMPALISHDIVCKISRTGKGKAHDGGPKISFDGFENLKKLVVACVLKNIQHCTLQEMNTTIGNWFRNWKDRQGGRKRRLTEVTSSKLSITNEEAE